MRREQSVDRSADYRDLNEPVGIGLDDHLVQILSCNKGTKEVVHTVLQCISFVFSLSVDTGALGITTIPMWLKVPLGRSNTL